MQLFVLAGFLIFAIGRKFKQVHCITSTYQFSTSTGRIRPTSVTMQCIADLNFVEICDMDVSCSILAFVTLSAMLETVAYWHIVSSAIKLWLWSYHKHSLHTFISPSAHWRCNLLQNWKAALITSNFNKFSQFIIAHWITKPSTKIQILTSNL
jgi:hypothetical protein